MRLDISLQQQKLPFAGDGVLEKISEQARRGCREFLVQLLKKAIEEERREEAGNDE